MKTWLTSSPCSASATSRKIEREAGLDRDRGAQRVLGVALRSALGDRAREQLFDRPVDDGDDDEHHRPQQVQALGVDFVQDVAGDREVREREQARRGDPDREDPRAAPVGAPGRPVVRGGRCARVGGRGLCGRLRVGGGRLRVLGARPRVGEGPRAGAIRGGQAASSTGRASGPRRPSRTARAARRSSAATSG